MKKLNKCDLNIDQNNHDNHFNNHGALSTMRIQKKIQIALQKDIKNVQSIVEHWWKDV